MKKKLLNAKRSTMRLTALLLSLVMMLSLEVRFPTTVKAAVVNVDEENKQYLEASKLALDVMAAATGSPELKVASVILFGAIFGTEDTSTKQITRALEELSKQLDDISQQISTMSSQLSNLIKNESVRNALQSRLNSHINLSTQYIVANKDMIDTMNSLSLITDETARGNAYKEFLLNTVTPQLIAGTDFNTAVRSLGQNILQTDASGLDLFQAYDKLTLYSYKWEHQGYAARRNFQAYTLALYTNLAALSMLSLTAKYDEAVKNNDVVGMANYLSKYNSLIAQIGNVRNNAKSHAVLERPADQRYYQVPGHEALFLAQTYLRTPKGSRNYGHVKSNVLNLGYPTGHSDYTYPSATLFQNIYYDYGNSKSLYNIFFDQSEGNLILPASVSASPTLTAESKSWWYQTNTFRSLYLPGFVTGIIYGTQAKPDGNTHEDEIAGTLFDPSSGRDDNPVTWVNEHYRNFGLSIIPRSGLVQGGAPFFVSGMADNYAAPFPSDIVLSVEESSEYQAFEWQLSRDGGNTWEIVPGGSASSLPLGAVDSSMKGYMYRCLIVKHNLDVDAESYYSQPVTLNLECPYQPTIYPDGGTVTQGQLINIYNTNDNTVSQSVYYTLDGSPVTTGSTLYTAPFALYGSTTVTAAVYDSVYGSSAATSATFTVLTSPVEDPPSIPSTPAAPEYSADVKAGGSTGTAIPVTVNKASKTAFVDAGSQKFMPDGTVVTIPSITDVDTYKVGIPVPALSTQGEQGSLTLDTDTGSVTVPSNMLTGITGISGSKAEISIGQGDKNNLPDNIKAAIGDKPMVSLSLSIDGKQTDWSNPNAPLTVSLPYTPTEAELANPESIVIWYIDGSGNVVTIPNGHYDAVTGTVSFTTTHFSDFAVAYFKVNFRDVPASAWYSDAVSFIAARKITNGTGEGNYSPEAKLTRGEFIVLMMRAYGIAPDANPTNNFSDAGSTYYTGYLAAAKHLGITAGVGNNMYAPGMEITRQEMFTLLYNALKVIGQLPKNDSGRTISEFADAGQIDSWAKEALTLLVKTGTVGGSGGKLTPTGTATRSEMAQVLYNLLGK